MTITAVKPTGTWQGPSDLLYVIQVSLSDGTSGEVMAKSPDRWSVGDEVEVADRKETQYGVKLKLRKPGYDAPAFGNGNASDRGKQIEAQWAINAALEYMKLAGQVASSLDAVEATAKLIIDARNKVMEHAK